jgi:DNA-binding transcriptional MerR regulator
LCHYEKLVEYGVMSSKQSADVKVKLDTLGLVKNEEYHLRDISEMVRPQGGGKATKVYMLTPEAFKTCLMRSRKYPGQTVDPSVYSKYYLLLEKTYKLYTNYQLKQKDQLLKQNQQQLQQKDQAIEQKDRQLEQKDQIIERKTHELEDERQYRLSLEEGLMGNTTPLEPVQIIYHQTLRV